MPVSQAVQASSSEGPRPREATSPGHLSPSPDTARTDCPSQAGFTGGGTLREGHLLSIRTLTSLAVMMGEERLSAQVLPASVPTGLKEEVILREADIHCLLERRV